MSDNEIVWETPPEVPPRNGILWTERLAPVMERPGEWARVHELGHSSAWQIVSQLRRGVKPSPPGRWEFVARSNKDDTSRAFVYARYLGPEDGA